MLMICFYCDNVNFDEPVKDGKLKCIKHNKDKKFNESCGDWKKE